MSIKLKVLKKMRSVLACSLSLSILLSLPFSAGILASAASAAIDFTNLSGMDENFDVYNSTDADGSGLVKDTAFTNKWHNIGSTSQIINTFDTSVISNDQSVAMAQQNDYVTSAIYKKCTYQNFQMTAYCSNWSAALGSGGAAAYFAPTLLFGVNDPTKWVNTAEGGFAACMTNEGSLLKGVVNGTYKSDNDPTDYKTGGNFGGVKEWTKITVRVAGKTATIKLEMYGDSSKAISYTYTLGNNYTGGYVGFAACGAVMRYWDFAITELPIDAEEYPATPKVILNNFSTDFGNDIANNQVFDAYSSLNAKDTGLTKANAFSDKWGKIDAAGNNAVVNKGDTSSVTQWDDKDKNVITSIYNQHTYRNFEMSVCCSSLSAWSTSGHPFYNYYCGNAAYFPPALIFGVEDPTKWVKNQTGGFEAMVCNDGNTVLDGYVDGAYKIQGEDTRGCMNNGLSDWYTLKVKVEGSTATITVSHGYNNIPDFSKSYDIGNNYKGGYVGFAAPGAIFRFWNYQIVDLGGDTANIVNVTSVADSAPIQVATGTTASALNLPSTVMATAKDGKDYSLAVTWDKTYYNPYDVNAQTISGKLSSFTNENGDIIIGGNVLANVTITHTAIPAGVIKVACVGDSITYGDRVGESESYPVRLQQYLGDGYLVANFGCCGTTVNSKYAQAYTSTRFFNWSLDFKPDIVILMLGSNDCADGLWPTDVSGNFDSTTFKNEYNKIVNAYEALGNNFKFYLSTSPTIYPDISSGAADTNARCSLIVSQVKQIAADGLYNNISLIDINAFTANHKDWFPDRLHPSVSGYNYIANKIASALTNVDSVLGDFDKNGHIDSNDMLSIRKVLLNLQNKSDYSVSENIFDINSDYAFDIRDLVAAKKMFG